jgi:hypothetical protein
VTSDDELRQLAEAARDASAAWDGVPQNPNRPMTAPAIGLDTPIKFLAADGSAPIGRGRWHLPSGDQPGKWMRQYKAQPIMCERGYHYTTPRHAMAHVNQRCFLIEPTGVIINSDDKSVAQGARLLIELITWNERTQRLFAADCAERVLHLCNADARACAAIHAARKYARGELTADQLDAARDAAFAAGEAAFSAGDAAFAAGDASRVAAWDAAGAAAWAAEGAAAREAAFAARDAAGAAGAAAASDEKAWQSNRLLQYLNGELT